MVKVQDFAKEHGVTDRAIQKHIQRHWQELHEHVNRRGKNGTWLDEQAQAFIESLMIQQPVIVSDRAVTEDNERLRAEIDCLRAEVERLNKRAEHLSDKLTESLEERTKLQALEVEAAKTSGLLEAAQTERDRLREDLAAASARAAEAEQRVQHLKNRTLWQRITRQGEETP